MEPSGRVSVAVFSSELSVCNAGAEVPENNQARPATVTISRNRAAILHDRWVRKPAIVRAPGAVIRVIFGGGVVVVVDPCRIRWRNFCQDASSSTVYPLDNFRLCCQISARCS